MNMSSIRLVACAALAMLTVPVAASAETITENIGNFNQTNFDTNGNLVINIPQFVAPDPGAQLAGATITLEGIAGPQIQVFNLSNVNAVGMGMTTVSFTLTGDAVSLIATASSGVQTVDVPAGFGNSASSPAGFSFFDVSTPVTNLAAFTGNGTTSLNLQQSFTTSGTTSTPGASVAVGGTGSSNFGLTISYNVPEPGSLALFTSGLLVLGMLVRRRAKG